MPDDPNEVVVIVPDAPADGATGSADGSNPSDSEPVVVEVFEAVADPTGGSDPTDSTGTTTGEPEVIVVEEGAVPDGGPEVIVIDPDATAPGTDGGPSSDPTSQGDPGTDPTGVADPIAATPDIGDTPTTGDPGPEGAVDPTGNAPETGDGTAGPGITDPTDPATTDPTGSDPTATGSDDPTAGGTIGSDPDTTGTTDPDTTGSNDPTAAGTTDPDSTGTTDPDSSTTDPDSQTPIDTTADQQTLEQEEEKESKDVQAGDYSAAYTDSQQAYQQSETLAGEGGPDDTDETWRAQLDESWANSDQQTADQDAITAASYANDPTGNPAVDAADAQLYGDAAQNEQQSADNSGEAGQYGDPIGEPVDTPTAPDETPAEEAPAEEAPAEEAPVEDTSTVDDDSSAS
jgi:hypothetical protein